MNTFYPSIDRAKQWLANNIENNVRLHHLQKYEELLEKLPKAKVSLMPAIDWHIEPLVHQKQKPLYFSINSFAAHYDDIFFLIPDKINKSISDTSSPIRELVNAICQHYIVLYCAPYENHHILLSQIYDYFGFMACEKLLIIADKNSNITIVNDRVYTHVHSITATTTVIHRHAIMRWIEISNQEKVQAALRFADFVLHDDAQLNYYSAARYAHNTLHEWHAQLAGKNSLLTAKELSVLHNHQKLMLRTHQHHQASNATSNLLVKGLLADHALFDYAGLVHISSTAHNTNAHQENKNMLFSEFAQARSIPSLEALTNDVQCSHGSATGYFDYDQLLYLQARGMSQKQAQRLLLQAFSQEILQDLDQEMRESFMAFILTVLP